MAEEKAPQGFLDSAFESAAGAIEGIIEPDDHSAWGTITHKWLSLKAWTEYVGDWAISRGAFLIALYIPLFFTAGALLPQYPNLVFGWLLFGLPAIAVTAGIVGFWGAWVWYVQSNFVFSRTNPMLLEVKMPAEVSKSPRAMEQAFANLWIRMSETTFIDRNWVGGVRPYFSFEMASFGGDIHFFIWGKRMFKNHLESIMYAQYPGVEITEVEDYASRFVYDDNYDCFVTDYMLDSQSAKAPDPLDPGHASINAYTPKTYIDFELDKDPKDEHRVDPFASVLEVLSSINKEEQIWIQMVIRSHTKKEWKETVAAEVEKIRIASTKLENKDDKKKDDSGFPRPTWRQTEQIRIMERHLSKLPFEVGMRGIYIAPAGKMRSAEYTAMRWIWRPFANPQWMSILRPRKWHNDFDYAWQDWNGVRYRLHTRRFLDAFRRRCVFNYPWKFTYHVFSTEMLATLWHPPSTVVAAPGLARIATTKAEAPSNLPI